MLDGVTAQHSIIAAAAAAELSLWPSPSVMPGYVPMHSAAASASFSTLTLALDRGI